MKTNEKNYNQLAKDEKAQVIYNQLKEQQNERLQQLLIELSFEYDTDAIFATENWLEYVEGTNLKELIKTVQLSKGLNIDDDYVRNSIYYDGCKSSDNVLDLVSEYEAIDWIVKAIDDNNPIIGAINSRLKIESYLLNDEEDEEDDEDEA